MRRHATVLFAIAALGSFFAFAASGAAADSCPNATFRTGLSASLPDCRAYEMVSPVQKGGDVTSSYRGVSPDGNRVGFGSNEVFAGALGGGAGAYSSERTASGWQTTALVPPFVGRAPVLTDGPSLFAVSADVSRVLFKTSYPVNPLDQGSVRQGVPNSTDLYRRNPDGSFTWVSQPTVLPDLSAQPVEFVAASSDLTRVLMRSKRVLAAGVSDETVTHLYLYADGRPTQLVDVDPEGHPVTVRPAESTSASSEALTQMSADGSRVAFLAGSTGAIKLYLRLDADDPALARTIDLGTGTEGRSCSNANLVKLSADGNRVLFECPDQLTDEPFPAAGGSQGLYLRDVDSGSLRLLGRVSGIGNGYGKILGATPSLSDAYFSGGGVGMDGSSLGSIVRLHDGRIEATAIPPVTQYTYRNWVSANGRYLAFSTSSNLGFPNAGLEQVYRYDGQTRELDCVSCRGDGAPSTGASALGPNGRYGFGSGGGARPNDLSEGGVSDAGEVFFTSAEALVPRDHNDNVDAYAWRDGRQYLISSGSDPNGAAFMRAAPDGKNVFFLTAESLVPADTDGGATDLYDARVDGGFPAPEPPTPCSGDVCQGPPAPQPSAAKLGSADFSGTANPSTAVRRIAVSVPRRRGSRGTAATLRVRVPAAGRISVAGGAIRPASRSVEAGARSLPVRLTGTAKRALRHRGRLQVKVRVSFEPASGGSAARALKLGFSRSQSGRVSARLQRSGS